MHSKDFLSTSTRKKKQGENIRDFIFFICVRYYFIIPNITVKGLLSMWFNCFPMKLFRDNTFRLCFDMILQETRCWAGVQRWEGFHNGH